MIFHIRSPNRWRYHFAFLPVRAGQHKIWLEKYATRYVSGEWTKSGAKYHYELDHPKLGRFKRDDFMVVDGMHYIKGEWTPQLRAA